MAGRPKGLPKTGGKKKGYSSANTTALKEMVLAALNQAGGINYLLAQSKENATAFLTLVGKVLPLTVAGDKENPLQVGLLKWKDEA